MQKITPFLWFNGNVGEAIDFYTSVFKNSAIKNVNRLPDDLTGRGKVLTATFELEGIEFMILDGGDYYKLNPAVSFFVKCKDQAEVDELWDKLGAEGQPMRCGWITDKFGVSWQIIPDALGKLMGDADPEKAQRVMHAMMKMVKIEVAGLEAAYNND
ncbi:hypothetical protein A0256_05070 [Mucilaginibacter sp. PAMC 26640]|nr:hypothetical protein A0256_05070 [Mucilaginibacter sp. PAMC 26640]